MTALKKLIAPVTSVVLATGCAIHGKGSWEVQEDWKDIQPATVEVQNDYGTDVDVHVIHFGNRTRLGYVKGLATRSLRLPRYMVTTTGTVQIQVIPRGSTEEFRTEPIVVKSGDRIAVTIKHHIQISSYKVWQR